MPTMEQIRSQLRLIRSRDNDPDRVFAIVEFNNYPEDGSFVAWSNPDERSDASNHAEGVLWQHYFMDFWQTTVSAGIVPETCTITIKMSPCTNCSTNWLGEIANFLDTNGIEKNKRFIRYLVMYLGLGEIYGRQGIDLAKGRYGTVQNYAAICPGEWNFDAVRKWQWELGWGNSPPSPATIRLALK